MSAYVFKSIKTLKSGLILPLIIWFVMLLTGCHSELTKPLPSITTPATSATIILLPTISAVIAVPDPSVDVADLEDPYSQISSNALEAYTPDRDLYNTLFKAIDKMETSVDVSGFNLSYLEKYSTCDSLYEQAGFQFYYLKRIKLSKDGRSVAMTYIDTPEQAKKNKEIFYGRLSHLIYNVAPDDFSPLQKLFAVYDYISRESDYTDNVQDPSTWTAYSVLMNGKGICGGFANLGYQVLNRVGIPTDYISNEGHAWNMVELDGNTYHTDITFGAGNTLLSDINFITNILMDDQQRLFSLGYFAEFPIIKGYPRQHPEAPVPCIDTRFEAFYNIFDNYALDIQNNWIYFYDSEGIKRMALEGTGPEIVSPLSVHFLTSFHDVLYFADEEHMKLYKLEPGKEAILLDDSVKVGTIHLENGFLYYGNSEDQNEGKKIDLNPFSSSNFELTDSEHLGERSIARQQSFKLQISFDQAMDTATLPVENVGLVDKEGQSLPIHMSWSDDGRTLTVRSRTCLVNESAVTLYVSPGVIALDGQQSEQATSMTVHIQ